MNILVSGVGGDIGFGVGRILRDWDLAEKIFGVDIHNNHAGSFIFDACSIVPLASDPDYLNCLEDYITNNKIRVFIPTSEAEIQKITTEKIKNLAGATIMITSEFAIRKSLDKHLCLSFLDSVGISLPKYGLVGQDIPTQYPVLVKPRSGQGSKGILRVDAAAQMPTESIRPFVWQEYLEPDEEEYTCPVFRSTQTGCRVLVMRRKLQAGHTVSGQVINNPKIYEYVETVAKAMQLDGVMNVQLRLTQSGPRLFEINPRMSSTLVFRDKMGFCDFRWWLALHLGLEIPAYEAPTVGTHFYRGAHEYIMSA